MAEEGGPEGKMGLEGRVGEVGEEAGVEPVESI